MIDIIELNPDVLPRSVIFLSSRRWTYAPLAELFRTSVKIERRRATCCHPGNRSALSEYLLLVGNGTLIEELCLLLHHNLMA